MTHVVMSIGYVPSIACEYEIAVPVSELVGDHTSRISRLETPNRVGMTPVVKGSNRKAKALANPLMRSEGR